MEEINKPIVFDHIADAKGVALDGRELSEFAAGIASSMLEERGVRILSACRLVKSDVFLLVGEERVYAISCAMFPSEAELSALDKAEAVTFAKAVSRTLYSFPISLFCLDGDGDKALSGAGYVVKPGDEEKI